MGKIFHAKNTSQSPLWAIVGGGSMFPELTLEIRIIFSCTMMWCNHINCDIHWKGHQIWYREGDNYNWTENKDFTTWIRNVALKMKNTLQRHAFSLRCEPPIVSEARVDCLPTRWYGAPRQEQLFCAVRLVNTPRTVRRVHCEQPHLLAQRNGPPGNRLSRFPACLSSEKHVFAFPCSFAPVFVSRQKDSK